MITLDYARTMARYNRWQNQSLVAAADTLSHDARWADRGTFFGSIAQTLNHILWDDQVWLARMDNDAATAAEIGVRFPYTEQPTDWRDFVQMRRALDDDFVAWTDALNDSDLARPNTWMMGDRQVETTLGFNFAHLVNHQTHHRGQVHGMLTQAGAVPDVTDLQMLPMDDA